MTGFFRKSSLPRTTAFLFVTCLWFSSCELINPDEPIPVYLACDSFYFHTSAAEQGTSSASITDAWVYVDGNLQGAYELPARFPVLSEGSHSISVKPGILINGIKGSRGAYPFYTAYDTTLNFEAGKTYSLVPRSTYLSLTQFKLMEDFEQSGLALERAPNSDTTLHVIQDANSFENHSGAIYLDNSRPYFNYRALNAFTVPPGTTVFAELNYKCDQEFTVGVLSTLGADQFSEDALTIRASSTWKKIYVSLSTAVNTYPNASYKLYITATKSAGLLNASIYLDNIKVLR